MPNGLPSSPIVVELDRTPETRNLRAMFIITSLQYVETSRISEPSLYLRCETRSPNFPAPLGNVSITHFVPARAPELLSDGTTQRLIASFTVAFSASRLCSSDLCASPVLEYRVGRKTEVIRHPQREEMQGPGGQAGNEMVG